MESNIKTILMALAIAAVVYIIYKRLKPAPALPGAKPQPPLKNVPAPVEEIPTAERIIYLVEDGNWTPITPKQIIY